MTTAAPDADVLKLENIRQALVRQEDSIVFNLIERAQYPINADIYHPERCIGLSEYKRHQMMASGGSGCFADYMMYKIEKVHAQARRYAQPTEVPFFGPLPDPVLQPLAAAPNVLAAHSVDINAKILAVYRDEIVPRICATGDDGNHGSAAVQDVQCLQSMATRIYYGLFVAESKFLINREAYSEMIRRGDRQGLWDAITHRAVEDRNVQRVTRKAATFSQEVSQDNATGTKFKIQPAFAGDCFERYMMPLTKEVEVSYLLQRLDAEEPPQDC